MTSTAGPDTADQGAGLSAAERAAVKQRSAEVKAQARRAQAAGKAADKAAADEADVLAEIAQMPDGDRALAERVHRVVTAAAPDLAPKLYYGQPGYARDGKVVCFFRSGQGDKLRYSTFGFSPQAHLDDDSGLWPTSYALTQQASEQAWEQIADLVTRAARGDGEP